MFLLLESFDIRENMFWCWQEDGGRRLPTSFLTMAKHRLLKPSVFGRCWVVVCWVCTSQGAFTNYT